jgi:pimeloyl-ACP methyl ester carboxylesterase
MIKAATLRNGLTLEYAEHGRSSGLPVVFLHGVTDSWRSFDGILPYLPSWMRAISVSQRGHGGSSKPVGNYGFADFSDDLDMFLDALQIPAAIVAGHSMGSYVAQRFAIDHPGRALGLLLMGSFASMRENAVVIDLWQSNVSVLSDPIDRSFILDFQQSTLARPVPPALLDTAVDESARVPASVWRATFAEFLQADHTDRLPSIDAPTLIVWGDQDAICLRSDQDALHRLIPDSQLIVYPGYGHAVHWEDPRRFTTDLVAFASRVER